MLGRSVATVSNGTQEEEGFNKDLIIHAQLAVARHRRGVAPEIGGGPALQVLTHCILKDMPPPPPPPLPSPLLHPLDCKLVNYS